jgi:hypothetical protein
MHKWDDEREPLNSQKIRKILSGALEDKLNKRYGAHSRVDDVFRGNDITFFTNEFGEAVTLYIGKRMEGGNIKGECYFRRIKKREGDIIKESHWDKQGKVVGKRSK